MGLCVRGNTNHLAQRVRIVFVVFVVLTDTGPPAGQKVSHLLLIHLAEGRGHVKSVEWAKRAPGGLLQNNSST